MFTHVIKIVQMYGVYNCSHSLKNFHFEITSLQKYYVVIRYLKVRHVENDAVMHVYSYIVLVYTIMQRTCGANAT